MTDLTGGKKKFPSGTGGSFLPARNDLLLSRPRTLTSLWVSEGPSFEASESCLQETFFTASRHDAGGTGISVGLRSGGKRKSSTRFALARPELLPLPRLLIYVSSINLPLCAGRNDEGRPSFHESMEGKLGLSWLPIKAHGSFNESQGREIPAPGPAGELEALR